MAPHGLAAADGDPRRSQPRAIPILPRRSPSAEPTRGYGRRAAGFLCRSTPNPYDNLPQNPIPQPQQTTYMRRARYRTSLDMSRAIRMCAQPYREYPKSIPQYGEGEYEPPSRSSSVIKKILIVLAIFFASRLCSPLCRACSTNEVRAKQPARRAEQVTEVTCVGAVELGDIPGQYWSNAKRFSSRAGPIFRMP